MFSRSKPIRPVPLNNDGSSFAKALGWTDVCTSGTGPINVFIGFDWDTGQHFDKYYAVLLDSATEYTFSGTAPYSQAKFAVYDQAGTKVAENNGSWQGEDPPVYVTPPLVWTPTTTGVYVVRVGFGGEIPDGEVTYATSISPRPGTYTREGFTPYESSTGFDDLGRLIRTRSAVAAGLGTSMFLARKAWLMLPLDGDLTDIGMNARTDLVTTGGWTAEGKFSGAAAWDGQAIVIPYTENPFAGDFTVQCWVKLNGSGRMCVMALADDQYIGIDNNNGKWCMWAGAGSWSILQGDTNDSDPAGSSGIGTIDATTGVWTHLAYVHYGDQWVLFVDGVESRRKTRSGTIAYANKAIRIGKWGGDIFGSNMSIDEFRIDTRALWTEAFTPPVAAYK